MNKKRINKSNYLKIKINDIETKILTNEEFKNGEPGYIMVPYVLGEHSDESLGKYNDFMEKYHSEHKYCPKCGGYGGITTFVSYVLIEGKEDEYKNLNSYVCDNCGDKHIVHDRVSKNSGCE